MTPIHTDNLHRIAYATDASAYRQMPYGVAFPQTPDDIPPLIAEARQGKRIKSSTGIADSSCPNLP